MINQFYESTFYVHHYRFIRVLENVVIVALYAFFCTHIGYRYLSLKNLKIKLESLRKLVMVILPTIYALKLILTAYK